jgi:hypothetical protein
MAAALVAGAVLAWRASATGLAAPGQGPEALAEASTPEGTGRHARPTDGPQARARPTVRA